MSTQTTTRPDTAPTKGDFSPEEVLLYRTLSGVIRRVEAKRAKEQAEGQTPQKGEGQS